MNVKSLLLLLTFAGFGASCNNDDANGSDAPGGRTEIQIAFSGAGESQEYTKATASVSENEIKTLQIHLFAAAAKGGPYYYLETWNDGNAFVPPAAGQPNPTNFKKTETGTGWKASLYPNEVNGLPFVKLMCIANNGEPNGGTTDGRFYEEDGITETVAALVPVTVGGDGKADVTGATTEAAFRATFTQNLGADAATGIIATPLVMTGTGETKIAGSVSKVDITLRRIVARFDIENDATKSNLTIEEVSLAQGRANGIFWGAARADVTQDNLITYQPIAFDKIPGANSGVTESAVYTYPNLPTDESFLILKGFYKSPISSELVPVTYNVPIVRTAEGATKGEYIPVMANSRYRLKITDVTQSNVFGTFEVVDWVSGGGIVVKPNNDAPVFAGVAAFTSAAGNLPLKLANGTAPGDTCNYEVTGDVNGKGSFTIEIAATGAVRAEKGMVTKAGETDWLRIGSATSTERDGVWYSKFDITYEESIGLQPVAVTFINETASYDPALWTTVNFYGPKALPGFAVVADGNSKGNLSAVDAITKAPSASLYSVNGSFVTFDITSIEGVTPGTLAGYKVEEVKTTGFVHTYKVSVSDAATADGGKLEFKNAGDDTKKVELNITKLDPSLKFTETTDAQNVGDYVIGTEIPFATTGILNIDLDALNGSYTFQIAAPKGLTATNLSSCPWLTITENQAWEDTDGKRFAQYTITKKANPANTDDFVLSFTNALTETGITAPGLNITMNKAFSKPKITPNTDDVTYPNSIFNDESPIGYPYAVTANMYKVVGSKIYLSMACPENMTVTSSEANVSVTKQADTNIYEINVTDVTGLGNTVTITAANDNDAERKATLTITLIEPAITLSTPAGSKAPVLGDHLVTIPADYEAYSVSKFTINGRKGSTITIAASTWFTNNTIAVIGDAGTAAITLTGMDPMPGTAPDVLITVHNAITGQDEVITIKKATP